MDATAIMLMLLDITFRCALRTNDQVAYQYVVLGYTHRNQPLECLNFCAIVFWIKPKKNHFKVLADRTITNKAAMFFMVTF